MWKSVLILGLGLNAHLVMGGKTFSKFEIPANFWEKKPAINTNFAGCSLACNKWGRCGVFAWKNGLCTLGYHSYSIGDLPSDLEEVYINRQGSHQLRMHKALNFDWAAWNATKERFTKFYEYGRYQFWRSLHAHPPKDFEEHCAQALNGKLMDNLHQEDIYHFVTTVVLDQKFSTKWGAHNNHFWLGLSRREEEGCTEDCQPKLFWDDGVPFELNGHFNTCFNFTAGKEPIGMTLTWNQCQDLPPFKFFITTYFDGWANYVCQVTKD